MNRRIGEEGKQGCYVDEIIAAFREVPDKAIVFVQGWPKLAEELQIPDLPSRQNELATDLFNGRKGVFDVIAYLVMEWSLVMGKDASLYKLADILEFRCQWKNLADHLRSKFAVEIPDTITWRELDEEIKQMLLESKVVIRGSVVQFDKLFQNCQAQREDILNIILTGTFISRVLNSTVEMSSSTFTLNDMQFADVLKVLLSTSFEPFTVDKSGYTMIHRGILSLKNDELHMFVEIVLNMGHGKMLLASKTGSKTPIEYLLCNAAIPLQTLELLHSSLKINWNLMILDAHSLSLLHLAIQYCQPKQVLEQIVKLGGDPNWLTEGAWNALHYAVYCGNLDAVEYFAALGCNVNQQDERGETPLHLAIWNLDKSKKVDSSYNDIVTKLLEHNADVNICDKNGCTPLSFAEKIKIDKKVIEQMRFATKPK